MNNDPALTQRLAEMLKKSIQFRIGSVNPELFADAKARGRTMLIPGPHSPYFLPDPDPTIRTGTTLLTLSALEVLGKPSPN